MINKREKQPKDLSLPLEGFARPAQFAYALGISESLFWEWVKEERIPKPIKIEGLRISRWPVDEVRRVIAEQGGYTLQPKHQEHRPNAAS